MPAVPAYIHRLQDGIPALEELAADWIDRRTLEEVLGVGKSTAWRILKRCGAQDGPGGALVCKRLELIAHLRDMQADPRVGPEIARRARLSEYLDRMLRYAGSRHQEIARSDSARAMLESRFAALPPGVDLEGRELRISFSGADDFLRKMGAVVFALHNDFDAIREFLESAQEPPL